MPGDQPTSYEHVTSVRDYSGLNNHKIDQDVQESVNAAIFAFEAQAKEFKT